MTPLDFNIIKQQVQKTIATRLIKKLDVHQDDSVAESSFCIKAPDKLSDFEVKVCPPKPEQKRSLCPDSNGVRYISEIGAFGLVWQIYQGVGVRENLLTSISQWAERDLLVELPNTLLKEQDSGLISSQMAPYQHQFIAQFCAALKGECGTSGELSGGMQAISTIIEKDICLSKIKQYAVTNMRTDVAHDEAHLLRVAMWGMRIKSEEIENADIIAAALLHDVVNPPKGSAGARNASSRSADVAIQLLRDIEFGDELRIANIAKAIEEHSYSRGVSCTSDLSRVLQDADRLDALGAIGIIRLFAVGAQIGAQPICLHDPFAANRALEDKKFSVDHFFVKLFKLSATMNTEGARTEGLYREQIMLAFLRALGSTLGASLENIKGIPVQGS